MELLVIRHGIAEERGGPDSDDTQRALTERGRRRMRQAARGLSRLVPELERICASPLLRAQETAAIVAEAFGDLVVEESRELSPGGGCEAVATMLRERPDSRAVAVIGHEPDLSELCTWLCAGVSRPILELRKGAACLIALEQGIGAARGQLRWSIPPRVLRRLRG